MTTRTFKKGFFKNSPLGRTPSTIVIHATGGSNVSGAEETLRANGYGYHYIIDKNGDVWKGGTAKMKLSHSGESVGPEGPYCNRYSIGISFVNMDGAEIRGEKFVYTGKVDPYTPAQVAGLETLIRELKEANPSIRWVTGHKDISPGRKIDPFGFDIAPLAKRVGLIYWKRQ